MYSLLRKGGSARRVLVGACVVTSMIGVPALRAAADPMHQAHVRASHNATTAKQMTMSLEGLPAPFALPGWMAITRSVGTGTLFAG